MKFITTSFGMIFGLSDTVSSMVFSIFYYVKMSGFL